MKAHQVLFSIVMVIGRIHTHTHACDEICEPVFRSTDALFQQAMMPQYGNKIKQYRRKNYRLTNNVVCPHIYVGYF